jgi:hypothetical protein
MLHTWRGEDDDEVEEELQRRDPVSALGLSITHTDPRHYSPWPTFASSTKSRRKVSVHFVLN